MHVAQANPSSRAGRGRAQDDTVTVPEEETLFIADADRVASTPAQFDLRQKQWRLPLVGSGRWWTGQALQALSPAHVDDAVLVVTELVSNAYEVHGDERGVVDSLQRMFEHANARNGAFEYVHHPGG
ncbi:hypothetical protein ABZ342_29515 [Amycolatopsis sp. NPDC005961]|uniref:hypothetical protein n=1 Tax=Amycolatopsis sp. NPDC005961 TaxID=3156720 RepID=UPI00340ED5A6